MVIKNSFPPRFFCDAEEKMEMAIKRVLQLLLLFLSLCQVLHADQWVQIGSGEINESDEDQFPNAHPQSGRMWRAAYAFDSLQGRNVLWLGASHGGLWKGIVNSDGKYDSFVPVTDCSPGRQCYSGSHTLGAF